MLKRPLFVSTSLVCLLGCLLPEQASAAPLFVEKTENLGSPQPCAASNEGCYSHYVLLVDLDGDADLDAVFANGGGYYTPATAAPLAAYWNDGAGQFTESAATVFSGFTGRVRQIAAGDIDGDSDIDLYLPDSYAMQADAFFVNTGQSPPLFVNEGSSRLPLSSRSAGARFGDVDNDGDLDLLLTDWGTNPYTSPGTARVYLNDGTGHFAEKAGAIPQNTQAIGTGPIDLDLFDADGDFDLDLLLASRSGESLFFRNDGTGHFQDANADLPDQPGPYVYGPDACDVDGDGDLDLWLDNGGPSLAEQLLINDGKGKFTDETAARVVGNPNADDNEVQCVDIDSDGDFDVVIASLSNNERVLLNDGTGHFAPSPTPAFPLVSDSTLGLDLGDVDGDGLLDAITAQGEAGSFLNRLYVGVAPQPKDMRPPTFRSVEQLPDGEPSGARVVRFAVSDASTTDIGPRLKKAYVELGGGGGLANAVSMGGDLWRASFLVGEGATVTYRACAEDQHGNAACSPWLSVTPSGGTSSSSSSSASSSSASSSASSSTSGGGSGGSGGGLAIGEEDGCACRLAPAEQRPFPLVLGAIVLAFARRVRRKRSTVNEF